MARPTQQEIDEWNSRMEEPDPDDDMVIIELPDGTKVHRKYGAVKGYLKSKGLDFDDVEVETEGGDPLNAGDIIDPKGGGTAPPQRASAKYFGGKTH